MKNFRRFGNPTNAPIVATTTNVLRLIFLFLIVATTVANVGCFIVILAPWSGSISKIFVLLKDIVLNVLVNQKINLISFENQISGFGAS